jgi:hypothetical protein
MLMIGTLTRFDLAMTYNILDSVPTPYYGIVSDKLAPMALELDGS